MKTEWNENIYFTGNFARWKRSKYNVEVSTTTDMGVISTQICYHFGMLGLGRMMGKGMDNCLKDETS